MLANDIRNYRTQDYISHHGILGQKHGVKNGPPYPLKAGDHSPAEKKAASQAGVKVGKDSGKGSMENVKKKNILEQIGDKIKADQVAKKRKAALDKAREAKQKKAEEAKAAEQHEADKKKALESGDYSQIQKYAHETSTRELQDALTRADTLKRLERSVIDSTPVEPTIWDQVSDAANKIGTATNAASKGIEAWNKVATVWNTFADPEAALPEIGKNFNEMKEKLAKDKAERARKAYVDQLTKTNDPDTILKNQEFFTNEEIKGAQGRLANIDSINKIKSNRANGSNSSDSSNSSNSSESSESSESSSKSNNNSDEEKIKEENKQKQAEFKKANEKRNAWKKEEQEKYWAESKEAFNKEVDRLLNPQNDRVFKIELDSFTSNMDKKYKPIINASVEKASTKSISDSSALSNSIFDYLNSVDSDWRMKQ